MFTIDLLKGKGIPAKAKPMNVAIALVTLIVPLIGALLEFGFYVSTNVAMTIQKQNISRYEALMGKLAGDVEQLRSLQNRRAVYVECLSEVRSAISRHTTWSPVLALVVESIPDSVVLERLEVRQGFIKKKVPKEDKPTEMVDISIPTRTLTMTVSGNLQADLSKKIRSFRERLCSSTVLGPRLEGIRVSQSTAKSQDQDVISYQISCIFKPGM